ncbi:uncharacterized protein EV420DRAFT_1642605 [Desarmillaria tabescens]|uniref:Uncharacterized protein n=1 Tax=Armillaria tabescens TaxID=1929756 RepID=A0AA39KFF4_ARMTA|nr:uncharacterized protein EV420DRAFT_1642605 [Desarmillaria tabescens]KAK0458891.1 hypothetical protein EV420DRAFT_1642605 [Desarmillaria tabescens]
MNSEIPLKARVDIRDQWDSPNAPIHTSIATLQKTLGHKISPHAEWPALWSQLKDRFSDKSKFVPTVISIVVVWYERLLGRLDNDVYADWTEELLSALEGGASLRIEPAPPKVTRPTTTWDRKLRSFHLGIPNAEPMSQARVASVFDKYFDDLFGETAGVADDQEDTEWAYVSSDPSSCSCFRLLPYPSTAGPSPSERLPVLSSLSRPSDLFTSTAPYILTITLRGREGLVVYCSHEPTLELLNEYLKKWAKTNTHDSLRRPIFKLTLVESDFCFGMTDTLVIEPYLSHHDGVNPTIVLAFIEGVVGYKMVYTTGSYWMYRCTTLFK